MVPIKRNHQNNQTNYSKIVGIQPTTDAISPQNLKKIIHIKTVQDCTQDRTLTDAISETEDV